MKKLKTISGIKKMHILVISSIMVCISIFATYIYAHEYIKNTFISKLADKGIHATIKSVSLKNKIILNNITLKVKNSKTHIKEITVDYSLNNILVYDANVEGSLQDYLDLKSSSNTLSKNSNKKKYKIEFKNCRASLSYDGLHLYVDKIYFSTSDSLIKAKSISSKTIQMNDITYSLNSSEVNISHLFMSQKYDKLAINKEKKKSDLVIFTKLPRGKYNIHIKMIGAGTNKNWRAKNVEISYLRDEEISLLITGHEIKSPNNVFSSDNFEIGFFGTVGAESKINSYLRVQNPSVINSKIMHDVYKAPMFVNINSFEVSADLLTNASMLKVSNGKFSTGEIEAKFSFIYSNGKISNYDLSLPKTECSKLMYVNPFKSVFHNKCSSELIDTGRCRDKNISSKDTQYSGLIEFSISGQNSLSPNLQFYSTCKFDNVPWYLERKRFNKPFSLRVGEPISREAGYWKPRKEIIVGPGTRNWAPLNLISFYVERALLVTEDGRFYSHNGIDPKAVAAVFTESFSKNNFARGGSTITMQLAKNLWLMRDKTIDRKVQELFLTMYLESIMSKSQIMELYLNVIEFGPNIYGIHDGAQYYFKKVPFDLTLKESLFLVSILPKPAASYFSGGVLNSGTNMKLNFLLTEMFKRNLISDVEMNEAKAQILYYN